MQLDSYAAIGRSRHHMRSTDRLLLLLVPVMMSLPSPVSMVPLLATPSAEPPIPAIVSRRPSPVLMMPPSVRKPPVPMTNLQSVIDYQQFKRVVPLPTTIQRERVTAKMEAGLLTLTMLKASPTLPNLVKVPIATADDRPPVLSATDEKAI